MKKLLQLALLLAISCCAGATFGQACTTPFTDSFTGTGALGSQWASPISTSAPNAVTKASGQAVSSGSGIAILNNYCGVFPATQSVTSAPVTVGNYSGPAVRMDSSGNGYAWLVNANQVYTLVNGGGTTPIVSGCPSVTSGQQAQLSIDSGFVLTCKNVTTGVSVSGTDASHTYASGYPGLFVWAGFPMGPVTIVSPLPQAAAPGFYPYGPALAPAGGNITVSCGTGTTPYYTTNGSTPTTSSTHYTTPVSITTATVFKSICAGAGYQDSDVTTQNYATGGGGTLASLLITPPATTGFWAKTTSSAYSLQLGVQCYYTNGTADDCSSSGGVTWMVTASGPSITSGGLLTGTSSIDAGFDVLAYIGGVLDHRQIGVTASSPTSIVIRPEATNNTIGDSNQVPINTPVTLGVGPNPNSATYWAGYCAWSSSNPTVATIDTYGTLTGHTTGTAIMSCTLPGQSASRTFTFTSPTTLGTLWYVRPDGGTRYDAAVTSGQCDGKADAPYPGSGTNQHCAFNEIMYLMTDESSSSVATFAMGPGDIATVYPKPGGYSLSRKNFSALWVAPTAFSLPSGSVTNPTIIRGSNYAACSTDPHHTGNRTLLNFFGYVGMDLRGVQNIKLDCMGMTAGQDCTNNLTGGSPLDIPCQNSGAPFAILANSLTTIDIHNSRITGASTGWTGTTSPGVTFTGSSVEYNYSTGINAEDPFGFGGNRSSGLSLTGTTVAYSGFTEEQPKTIASLSRDGSGHLNVTFAAGQLVNYEPGTNLYIEGSTPSDLSGTFPVTSVSFTQNVANITGGSCTSVYGQAIGCTFTTASAVTFPVHSFVHISGASPSWLNGGFFVSTVSGSSFTIYATPETHPGWTAGAISSGGTAATALSLVASASGSSESASTLGTAGHVFAAHMGYDQNNGGNANGDGVGTGADTFGGYSAANTQFIGNTQDGWDMLHSSMTSSIFIGNLSEGNMGAPSKFGNTSLGIYQSNVQIGNAARMSAPDPNLAPDYNQFLSMFYRAANVLPISEHFWSKMDVSNNTWMFGFPTGWDDVCQDAIGCGSPLSSAYFVAQNNIFIGFWDQLWSANIPAIYFYNTGVDPTPAPWVWNNNIGYNVRNPPSGGTGNNWTTNPLVVQLIPDIPNWASQVNSQNWNLQLTSPSPARSAGLHNAYTPTTDFAGNGFLNPPAIGAYEFGGSTPQAATPTFSPVAGTYTSTQSVTISSTTSGATLCYTTDGSTPTANGAGTCTHGTTYSTAVSVAVTLTLKAVASKSGLGDSGVGLAGYVINIPVNPSINVTGTVTFSGTGTAQ